MKQTRRNHSLYRIKAAMLVTVMAVLFCMLSSCNKQDSYTPDYQYNYYPLDSGHYVVYDVDSVTYRGVGLSDTVRFQWKEIVADTFYDNTNQLNYRIEVYRRANTSSAWYIDRVWSARRSTTSLEKNEDEIRFVKLIFPPREGEEWNGNQYVPTTSQYDIFLDWNYYYSGVGQAYAINGFNFTESLTVNMIDDENVIEKRLRKEVYVRGVGLVYQEWEALTKNNVGADWVTGPEEGFRIRMRVAEHN